ncbi:MAG: PKD domain-containing protein [Bacteroidales bacterium]|jgi:hypothetical protein|nr:PKD domain-containing protein [Bacteroidales bacterium]
MKKIILSTLVLPFILVSCEMSPEAYFSATPGDPTVGEEVWFTNESDNASSFEWDFGDGYISNEPEPVHAYKATGSYKVVLTAWSHNGLSDEASLVIDVRIPTLLEIEVLEYYEEYPVSGASVMLYPTLADWDRETNMITEGFTDSEGRVVFADLDNYVHYVDVWEESHNNYALRDEDVGFIRTPEIMLNRINRFIAYVDYVEETKGEGRRGSKAIIRKIERKVIDKHQPEPYSDDENWQVLYSKRVVTYK